MKDQIWEAGSRGNVRQDLRDIPGMLTLLTGPKDPTVTPSPILKVCWGDAVQKDLAAAVL